ncbi:MAG: HlyC/CorC family transporter [Rhodospirillales bacterium]|nr:HlyC/CorC family transporter [Rhodospirillales bacterium]
MAWLKTLLKSKSPQDTSLREALEEVIEEFEDHPEHHIAVHERILISNVLKLRDMTVFDVMVPRADIVAISLDTENKDLLALLSEKQYSRLPVYRDNLDDVIGTIHIKDILAELAQGHQNFKLKDLIRSVPIVSPAMPVLDLMLQMQQSTKHLALVVDEYGGIDGLVTIGDLVESIVGEIDDEFQNETQPALIRNADGTLIVDARYDLDEFEEEFGKILPDDEREDIDTLGGLAFALAGRIPARGEILTHEQSGLRLEILDADPRRVNRLKIRDLPSGAS